MLPTNPHDASIVDLLNAWKDNPAEVVDNLARRHAAIAVNFLIQGAQDGHLTRNDGNVLANLLMDHFIALRVKYGITATERNLQRAEL